MGSGEPRLTKIHAPNITKNHVVVLTNQGGSLAHGSQVFVALIPKAIVDISKLGNFCFTEITFELLG